MLKSKFSNWTFLPTVLTIALLPLVLYLAVAITEGSIVIVAFVVLLFALIWLIFGELRKRIIVVTLDDQELVTRAFLGLGKIRTFRYSEFDEYKTASMTSRGGTFEYLYLMKNNQRIVTISEFYHRNYSSLKAEIEKKVKYSGVEPVSYLREFRDIFN